MVVIGFQDVSYFKVTLNCHVLKSYVEFTLFFHRVGAMVAGNTLASHLSGWGLVPGMASSGKAGSSLLLVGSLQYRTLTNCMYWFTLPFQLPVVI